MGGNDVVRNMTDIPSMIDGGLGADILIGGLGDDEIHAGDSDFDLAFQNAHEDAANRTPEQLLADFSVVDNCVWGSRR